MLEFDLVLDRLVGLTLVEAVELGATEPPPTRLVQSLSKNVSRSYFACHVAVLISNAKDHVKCTGWFRWSATNLLAFSRK